MYGGFTQYVQAIGYTTLYLFHSIPEITDRLRRLPVGDTVITTLTDPRLMSFYAAFFIIYIVVIALKMMWVKRST